MRGRCGCALRTRARVLADGVRIEVRIHRRCASWIRGAVAERVRGPGVPFAGALSALETWSIAVMIDSAPAEGAHWVTFRGVPLARLADVLRTGIDVTPTDAPIFGTDGVDKAFEYARPVGGGTGPGLILALRGPHLERTFRDLDADASPAEIAVTRETYPHPAGNPGGRPDHTGTREWPPH